MRRITRDEFLNLKGLAFVEAFEKLPYTAEEEPFDSGFPKTYAREFFAKEDRELIKQYQGEDTILYGSDSDGAGQKAVREAEEKMSLKELDDNGYITPLGF